VLWTFRDLFAATSTANQALPALLAVSGAAALLAQERLRAALYVARAALLPGLADVRTYVVPRTAPLWQIAVDVYGNAALTSLLFAANAVRDPSRCRRHRADAPALELSRADGARARRAPRRRRRPARGERRGTRTRSRSTCSRRARGGRSAFWRSSQWDDDQGRRTRIGDPVVVTIDGAAQLVGASRTWQMPPEPRRGRDATSSRGATTPGAAISAGADPTLVLRNVTLQDALTRLFAPLGITVVFGAARRPGAPRAGRARAALPPHAARAAARAARPLAAARRREDLDSRRRALPPRRATCSGPRRATARAASRCASMCPRPARRCSRSTRRESADGTRRPREHVLDERATRCTGATCPRASRFGETAQGDAQSLAHRARGHQLVPARPGLHLRARLAASARRSRTTSARRPRAHVAAARQEAARVMVDAERGASPSTRPTHTGHGQMVGGQTVLYAPNLVAR
jgi:hypothetical protein